MQLVCLLCFFNSFIFESEMKGVADEGLFSSFFLKSAKLKKCKAKLNIFYMSFGFLKF